MSFCTLSLLIFKFSFDGPPSTVLVLGCFSFEEFYLFLINELFSGVKQGDVSFSSVFLLVYVFVASMSSACFGISSLVGGALALITYLGESSFFF